jgi:hypothetical protein
MRAAESAGSWFDGSELSVAPLVGAAGGVVAISVAAQRFGAKREVAAFGGAAIAFAASQATSGVARALLQGAVLAGIGVGVAELVRRFRQDSVRTTGARPPGPPPDAVKHGDLERALAEAQARNAAIASERDQIHSAQIGDLQDMVRGLVHELRLAKAENAQLRSARAESDVRDSTPIESVIADRSIASDQPEAESGACCDDVFDHSNEAPPDRSDVDGTARVAPDAVSHLSAVCGLLDESERQVFSTFNATAPTETVDATRDELLRRSPADAVTYLRRVVFPAMMAAASRALHSSEPSPYAIQARS